MAGHHLKLSSDKVRSLAHAYIDRAPEGTVVKFETEPKRSTDQNALMWCLLDDISKQVPHNGKHRTPESWKLLMMHALKYECQFEIGLNGEPFPAGFRTSQLGVKQMSELLEFIFAYGSENNVIWSEKGWKYEPI